MPSLVRFCTKRSDLWRSVQHGRCRLFSSHAALAPLCLDLISRFRFLTVPSSLVRRHVWRAIIKSSSVGMTHAEAALPVVVILGPPTASDPADDFQSNCGGRQS